MINGLWIGLILSIKFLLSTQRNDSLIIISLLLSISIIIVLFKFAVSLREKEFGGKIHFGKAFNYIFLLYFYGAVISSLVMLIFTTYINKGYLDTYFNETLKLYQTIKLPIDDNSFSLLEKIFKPAPFALGNLLSSVFVGTFWSLILSVFVKKEKSIFE